MNIKKAGIPDIPDIDRLLYQVLEVHHEGRPDLFRGGCKKYTDAELAVLLQDENRPVFGAWDESGALLGYAFCIVQEHKNDNVLTDIRTLYIDDLCVDQTIRRMGTGQIIYNFIKDYAKEIGCYHLTLNVWACNPSAMKFYEKQGMQMLKKEMEVIL